MHLRSWACSIFTPFVLILSSNLDAQDSTKIEKPSLPSTKTATPPKIDGKLDDAAWLNAPVASGFITFLPEYNKIPSRNTEVKVVYDNVAIYIGAVMYDPDPSSINTQLSERDGGSNADNFTVGFDTYDDDLNGYRFTVSASGVQSDQRFGLNSNGDMSWDAVWESDVSINESGWIAEIKIPYSAIRFPSKPEQNWGLQFNRNINSTGEFVIWSPVDPKVYGIINQWGSLTGLTDIIPPLRLSFSPYLNAGFQWDPVSYDPVEYGRSEILNGGLDVKYGINESFTIDATLIPNFGEVQSDNVILNLSPFEQQFDERRPFFTEGTEIFNQTFNFIGDKLFYSRRIGGLPFGYFDVYYNLDENEEVIDNPSETSLYNATKFSGRTDKGLGIGIFNAIAAQEFATVKNIETGEEHLELTNPLTNYNMIVFEQSLKNNSKVSFTNTNTMRESGYRDANVTQGLFDITNEKHTFNWWGFGNVSQVFEQSTGENGEIVNDPKVGYSYIAGISTFLNKWNINFSHALTSPEYDHNDMGIQFGNNFTNNYIGFNYNNQEPKKGIFYNYNFWGGSSINTRVEPLEYEELNANAGFNGQFKNFWNAGLSFFGKPFYFYDFYEPRFEGYKYRHYPFGFVSAWGGTDYRKDLSYNLSIAFGESPYPNDPYYEMGHYLVYNISDHASMTYNLFMSKDHNNFGFVDYGYGETDELIIYFGRRNITTISQEISGKYIFGPKMNIIARARYYWGKVNYKEYYELMDDGNLAETDFTGNYDLNFNIFNVDFVYAWEFAPGSYLNVIWKNNIFQSDDIGTDDFIANCKKTFTEPQTNGLSVKLIYYFDYLYLKKNSNG